MTKRISLKEYSDWLFEDKSSIIYEKKSYLKEDATETLLDLGQFVASVIGAFPPLEATGVAEAIDFANGIVYAVRGQYVFSILSFIGAFAPIIGDLFKEGGMIITWLTRLIEASREETRIKNIAEWSLQNAPKLKAGIEKAIPWLRENKEDIKNVIDAAAAKVRQARAVRAGETEQLNEQVEPEESFTGPFSEMFDAFISNERVNELLRDSNIVENLKNAVEELINLLERALDTINRLEQETDVSENETGSLNEHVLTDIRFKKLAGLID